MIRNVSVLTIGVFAGAIFAGPAFCQDAASLEPKGGSDSLLGSWSQTVPIDLGDGTSGTVFVILTFAPTRFTFSIEFMDVIFGESVPTSFTGSGVYETNTGVTPNRLTITYETIGGEPFMEMAFSIFEISGTTLRLGTNASGGTMFPPDFASAEFVEEYEAVGTRSVCSEASVSELMSQLEDLRMMAELPNDFDNDGVPEDALLELIRFVSCGRDAKVPSRTNIADATQSAFLLNASMLRQNGITEFAEVAALLGLAGTTTQAQMRAALQDLGFTVPDNLALVTCDDNECRADAQLVNEVFFGDSDLDGDGLTNRQEFEQSGGDVDRFVTGASDEVPGINQTGGCASSANSNIATRRWDAMLLILVGSALALYGRRSPRRVAARNMR